MAENIEDPTLAQVIKDAIENRLIDVHTSMPGTIISYDKTTKSASVQPNLKKKYLTGRVTDLPIINKVPVHHVRGGKAMIKMPVAAGDPCTLFFAERSIDIWKSQGGQVDPKDTRKHDLSDAYCIVGIAALNDTIPGEDSDMVLINDKSKVVLKASGKASVTNTQTGDELVDLTNQMATLLSTDTVNTIFGPMKLNGFATYAQIATKLGNIKV